jgi:hypothetical protein
MMKARCDLCRQPLRANLVISGPEGLQFDSLRCRERHLIAAQFMNLQNASRVARSRLKATTISRAGRMYRKLGGRHWSLTERLLRAVL